MRDESKSGIGRATSALGLVGLSLAAGCADEELRRLEPVSVALSDAVGPVYDDGELTIYEAKAPLMLPIAAPTDGEMERLAQEPALDPFARRPWVTSDDVAVQINWTLSNLDPGAHDVWIAIEPWNEFARYEPAITVTEDEATRDFSGIDILYHLPGVSAADPPPPDEQEGTSTLRPIAQSSRIVGTFTFDDMQELALDLATVFKIVADAVPVDATEGDPRSTLVNHAFNVRNRSYNSPLLEPYAPTIVPGLVGFDFGVRTARPANVALEIVVEVRDLHGARVVPRGESTALLEAPEGVIASTGGP